AGSACSPFKEMDSIRPALVLLFPCPVRAYPRSSKKLVLFGCESHLFFSTTRRRNQFDSKLLRVVRPPIKIKRIKRVHLGSKGLTFDEELKSNRYIGETYLYCIKLNRDVVGIVQGDNRGIRQVE